MDKRYQVFISSTFEDLQEERSEVMQALLELDCIPAGMELFPASNEDQWSLIKRVIDDCDYYILIIGGRYGSCNNEGISYTEQEFRYALETNKPIISFLHKAPGNIINSKSEQNEENKVKLENFRKLAQKKMVKYWTNPEDLGSIVSRSMIKLIKNFPAIGWIKADNITSAESTKEILDLKKEIEFLQSELKLLSTTPPPGTQSLSQGKECIKLTLTYNAYKDDEKDEEDFFTSYKRYSLEQIFNISWDELFKIISPYLIVEGTETQMVKAIINYLKSRYKDNIDSFLIKNSYRDPNFFELIPAEFQTIKIQFKALGLITESVKARSVKDRSIYWKLTPYGEFIMTNLISIKSNIINNPDSN